jgi:carboxyl-terminal processing protease
MVETIRPLSRESKGPFLGIIVDLRPCGGGLLHTAVAVSAAFLPPGTLVTHARGRAADSNRKYYADRRDYLRGRDNDPIDDLPPEFKSAAMVVIVGPKTAAGAEIAASALQDNKRAVVIGERSFGRGTIETIIPFFPDSTGNRSAIKLTTARVFRPNGEALEGKGVVPDVSIEPRSRPTDRQPGPGSAQSGSFDAMGDRVVVQALDILKSNPPMRH